jgi:hypothetical protein
MKNNVLERDIRSSVIKWARQQGIIVQKMNGQFSNGFPDDLFLLPRGKVAFIEFKAPGKKPTPLQERRIKEIAALGHNVIWTDSVEHAKEWLLSL